jgi:cobalt-zinc-cadmium efflux system outer membrane protein
MARMHRIWIVTGLLGLAGCGDSVVTDSRPGPNPAMSVVSPEPAPATATAKDDAFVEPEGPLDLPEAMALSLLRHPELRMYSTDIRIAEARRLQAGLRPNPELGIEVENFGGTAPINEFEGAESTVKLSQEIETAGKLAKRKQVANLDTKLADWDYRSKKLDILAQVRVAFVRAWIAQEQLAVAEDQVRLSQTVFDSIRALVESGRESPVDLSRAQVVLAEQQLDFRKAQEEAALARKLLAGFWAGENPKFTSVRGESLTVEPVADAAQLREKIAQNPDLLRWETEMQQRRAQLALERAKGTSNFVISGGYKRLEESHDNAFIVGLSIPLPISDRNQGGKLEAAHQLARVAEEKRLAELQITQSFHTAYSELTTTHHQIEQIRSQILPSSQKVFDAARTGYEQGKFGYLTLLDAQKSLFETRRSHLESLQAYHLARIEMDRLTGERLETFSTNSGAKDTGETR